MANLTNNSDSTPLSCSTSRYPFKEAAASYLFGSADLESPQTFPLNTKLKLSHFRAELILTLLKENFKITFARDCGSPQIMEDNAVIRDFPLGCRGPSANSWCLGWLAQRPQDLRHIYAELLPHSTLLSKYLSHISGIWCSSWDFSPFKSCFYWNLAKLAGCSKLNIYLLFYCQLVSHHMSLDAFMQITTGSLKPDKAVCKTNIVVTVQISLSLNTD